MMTTTPPLDELRSELWNIQGTVFTLSLKFTQLREVAPLATAEQSRQLADDAWNCLTAVAVYLNALIHSLAEEEPTNV